MPRIGFVMCPDEAVGAVVGDAGRRGGQVLGLDVRESDGERIVGAEPLAGASATPGR